MKYQKETKKDCHTKEQFDELTNWTKQWILSYWM